MLRILLLMSLVFAAVAQSGETEDKNTIPLVGFFHSESSEAELAFSFAVNQINKDKTMLPDAVLVPNIEHVRYFDSFNTSRRASSGIGAIFGPQSAETIGIVQSISTAMDIPHIQMHWDLSSLPGESSLNLYPPPYLIAKALRDVVEDMDWTSYTIIYEDDEALIRIQDLLKTSSALTEDGHIPFTAWQLPSDGDEEPDYRPLLKEIKRISDTHIILDCSPDKIIAVLKQAQEVDMMGTYNSYVLTSLDAHTIDFGEFKYGPTNITTISIVDPTQHYVQASVQDWIFEEMLNGRRVFISPETITTESALVYDAVNLYATAVHKIGREVVVEPNDCDSPKKWDQGLPMINYMRLMEMEGMTGPIKFDETGRRKYFTVYISELTRNGFRKIGSWDTEKGISYTRTKSEMDTELFQNIYNRTFIVVSRIGEPYLRIRDENAEGNDRYEGYSMDLIDEIAKELNVKYKFYLTPDNRHGSFNRKTKQWDGLIRELRERRADLAICDLTITYDRRSAVDFTMPFMTLGISILFSKPTSKPPNLFSFLLPFSLDVWIYMATAYLGVSLILYFLSRCTPGEWEGPHPCDKQPTELECIFSLHNCLWFCMPGGCDFLPKWKLACFH